MKKLLILFLFIAFCAESQIRLPKLISDGMVLQRNTPLIIWGWASANEKVTLTFKNQKYEAITDATGKWQIQLPSQSSSGSFEMFFEASNKVHVKDIVFGDVWLCSGQSNMELMMERVKDKYPDVISTANNPQIRQFTVPDVYDFKQPKEDFFGGKWESVSPKTITIFSAVAYFFAQEIYKKTNVPIGIINAALGGSPVQAWMSEDALQKFPEYLQEGLKFRNDKLIEQTEQENRRINSGWHKKLNSTDDGLKQNWHSLTTNDSDWKEMNIPNYWPDVDSTIKNGTVWFRKTFDVPNHLLNTNSRLFLGRIVDADSVFLNGKFIGTTSYQYPPRKYNVSKTDLKPKDNVLSVRVINSSGNGGFVPDKPYQLIFPTDTLDLSGKWKYKIGTQVEPISPQVTVRWKPMGLYNAMISPLSNYQIKGALWYQGESNADNPNDYEELLSEMIADWRKTFENQSLPFIYVQLANYLKRSTQPQESNWATLRQEQFNVLKVPNTAMVVAIDLGEWNDIHPLNKKDVGLRLALQAQKLAYQSKIVASGPIIQSAKIRKNKIVLKFSEVGGGLVSFQNEKKVDGFEISENGKDFISISGKIVKNTISIEIPFNTQPTHVRYAWADNPLATLYNKEKLPASPFEIKIED